MKSVIRKLLGLGKEDNFALLYKNGAHIVDVRTKHEFDSGHIQGSFNIPLNDLHARIERVPRDTVIITCCASGVRSESAKTVLQKMGFHHVYNGASWIALKNKIHS